MKSFDNTIGSSYAPFNITMAEFYTKYGGFGHYKRYIRYE